MKAPYLPEIFRLSRPLPHFGHWRGSLPSPLSGKTCGPSISFNASRTSPTRRSLISPTARDEVAPEIAQHLLAVEFVVGDQVELFLEIGREIVFDVALEEAFEERDDEAALVLGDEPLLFDPDVVAIDEHGHRRGIGRRAADAELFHPLDERRFGKARRRLR